MVDWEGLAGVRTVIDRDFVSQIKDSHRGSSYICVPCYRNVAKVKTHLDRHKTTRTLAAMNQSIMEAQDDAFMEESDGEYWFCARWAAERE